MRQATFIFLLIASFYQSFSQSLPLQVNTNHIPNSREKVTLKAKSVFEQAIDNKLRNTSFILSLPIRNANMEFNVTPNAVYEDDLNRENPEILTFDLQAVAQPQIIGALTLSQNGLYATILHAGEMISIYPDSHSTVDNHIIEYGSQPDLPKPAQYCSHDHSIEEMVHNNLGGNRSKITTGTKRRTYRTAIACTGEYYINNGNADGAVRTSIINTVNAISAIFKNDMSYILSISASRIQMYKDPATDPFIPDNAGGLGRTEQAGKEIASQYSATSYDIGHVFHQHADGDNWSNGGLAQLNSVCNNNIYGSNAISKASGWSGAYSNVGNDWISLATHEFGHQFGATHTFNGDGGSCSGNISSTTAYEIGSGTTIMSYNGICDPPQNIPNSGVSDNYFHIASVEQMYNYVYNGNGGSCGSAVDASKVFPSITIDVCQGNKVIPKNTPFFINSNIEANANESKYTYCWEQIDEDGAGSPTEGLIGTSAASNAKAPLFRSYPPSADKKRYFPSMDILLAGTSNNFDVLPTVARDLHFNVSLRDNDTAGGAIANDEITITVNNTGPFTITRPNGGETLQAGISESVVWTTNGSNSLCDKIRIRVSSDGGRTFPIILAENVPYGTGSFNIPIGANFIKTTEARLLLECMDNPCYGIFNVSKNNFTINSTCVAEPSVVCPATKISLNEGDPGLNISMSKVLGKQVFAVSKTMSSTLPLGRVLIANTAGTGCADISNFYYDTYKFYVAETGSYTIEASDGGFVTLMKSGYVPGSGCSSNFIASTRRQVGTMNLTGSNTNIVANLTACQEYTLIFYSFEDLPQSVTATFKNGPGPIVEKITSPNPSYTNVYVVINNDSGNIYSMGQTLDLTSAPAGNYTITSIVIDKSINLLSLNGTNYSNFLKSYCLNESYNSRQVEIIPSCTISSIVAGSQGPCVASTNFYTQDCIITYEKAPTTGMLNVNGQLFAITTSPQTVTLINLDSDGTTKDIKAFFTDSPTCAFTKTGALIAPVNCCPVVLELGQDISKCVGQTVDLDAGDSGQTYTWYKDGILINSQTTKKLTVSTSGKYEVEVIHSSGCKRTDFVNVVFKANPSAILPAELEFCANENFILEPTYPNQVTSYEWYKDGSKLIQNDPFIVLSIPGTYKVIVTNNFGCTGEASTIISSVAVPVVDLGNAVDKCEGEVVLLDAGKNGTTYTWYKDGVVIPNVDSSAYYPKQSGTYKVIVTNSASCTSEDDVLVKFFASPIVGDFPPTIDACQGTTTNLIAVASMFQTGQWYYNTNIITGSTGLTLTVQNSGSYSFEATNNIGCKTRKSTTVNFRSYPVVNIDPTIVSCVGYDVILNAGSEGTTYKWQKNGTTLSNIANTLTVSQDGLYSVTVTNNYGCSATSQSAVSFVQGPTVTSNGDATICEGESHNITVTTSANNSTYRWFKDGALISGELSSTLNVTTAGTYEVEVKGGTPACEVKKSIKITVNPKPTFSLGTDKTLCEGDAYPILDAGASNTSFEWTLNGNPLASTQKVTADKSGIYSVNVKNSFNCSRTKSVTITIEPLPTLVMNADYALCSGSDLTIAPQTNGTTFEWYKGTVKLTNEKSNSLKVVAGGTYKCIAFSQSNCKVEKSFTVTERQRPMVSLGKDTILCPKSNFVLDAGTQAKYLWSDNTTLQTLTINTGEPNATTTKQYAVTVTNSFGCTDTDTIKIVINQIIVAGLISDNAGVCNGNPVNLTASGGKYYKWSGPAGSLSNFDMANTVANPMATTTFTVEISDDCPSNTTTKSIEIKVFEPNDISAGIDTCVVLGRSIHLNAKGGVSYEWDPVSLIVGQSNISNPEVKPEVETTFMVTIIDKNGCEYTDEVVVCVKEDSFREVSIITPNGDGKNDDLYFGGLEAFPDNTLRIFNRWGDLIYKADGYQSNGEMFSGLRNGERLPADTYYYVLKFDNRTIKNSLTILWD